MRKIRTICVVTGSRADYGLLYTLMRVIEADSELSLKLLVTGSHLSGHHDHSINEIREDGFVVDAEVDLGQQSDRPLSVAVATGRGVSEIAKEFSRIKPDIVIVTGDRFEMLAAAVAAFLLKLPLAHIAGGHVTEGAMDDAIRHAITKLSNIHFTSVDAYHDRIIQMGESAERVFVVGSTGLDNILGQKRVPRDELERELGIRFRRRNLLITFHPATRETGSPKDQVDALLAALGELRETLLMFTAPNNDPGSGVIAEAIRAFVDDHRDRSALVSSLGRIRYPSLLACVDGVVGNSSSGLIEAPSFKIGTINIGTRQKGRVQAKNVINCEPDTESIRQALEKLFSPRFRAELVKVRNPFGDGRASERIRDVLREIPLSDLSKSTFYDQPIAEWARRVS